MSSSIDRLVPVLNGTNWLEWSTLMKAYLNMNDLWEICSEITMPVEPKPTVATRTVDGQTQRVAVPPSEEAMADYNAAMAIWKPLNAKALGAITLRLAPSLRHHLGYLAQSTWNALQTAFGAPSVSGLYSDFKQVLAIKLSGGNPIPDLELFATLFRRLQTAGLEISDML